MNYRILLDSAKSCILASSVPRRQQFLIRCVGGSTDQRDMQALRSLEVDSQSIIRAITPALDPTRHKGQAGITYDPFFYFWAQDKEETSNVSFTYVLNQEI